VGTQAHAREVDIEVKQLREQLSTAQDALKRTERRILFVTKERDGLKNILVGPAHLHPLPCACTVCDQRTLAPKWTLHALCAYQRILELVRARGQSEHS